MPKNMSTMLIIFTVIVLVIVLFRSNLREGAQWRRQTCKNTTYNPGVDNGKDNGKWRLSSQGYYITKNTAAIGSNAYSARSQECNDVRNVNADNLSELDVVAKGDGKNNMEEKCAMKRTCESKENYNARKGRWSWQPSDAYADGVDGKKAATFSLPCACKTDEYYSDRYR